MRAEIEQHKRRLDDLFSLIDDIRAKPNNLLSDGSRLLPFMQDYLVVAINSFVEQSIRTILIDYASDNITDVGKRQKRLDELKQGTTYNFGKIKESVARIESEAKLDKKKKLAGKLEERMPAQSIKAIADVLDARHDVAHRGKPTSLTYRDIRGDTRDKGIYYRLVEAIRIIDGLITQ